jgi:type II secretory pathway pseudopilin PulG
MQTRSLHVLARAARRLSLRGEGGFTIVEVITSMMVVAVVATGAAAMAGMSSGVQVRAKVRSIQASAAEGAMSILQEDQAWPETDACKSALTTPCDVSYVLSGDTDLTADSHLSVHFVATARALGVDSPIDGQGAKDADGIVPDYYRVSLTLKLAPDSQAQYPNMTPLTLTGLVNRTDQMQTGKLDITACAVAPQVDERSPVATCPILSAPDIAAGTILPPSSLLIDPKSGDVSGCDDVSESRDCASYLCASLALSAPDCFGNSYAPTLPTLDPTDPNTNFLGMDLTPGNNWGYKVVGDPVDPNTRNITLSGTLDSAGHALLLGLTPGSYTVTVTPAGSAATDQIWISHSLPAAGKAAVIPGQLARSVSMFRPPLRKAPLRIAVYTYDKTIPWPHAATPGLWPGKSITYQLAPSPIGRTQVVTQGTATYPDQELDFPNADPGLYEAYLTNSDGSKFKSVANQPGFFWLPSDASKATDTYPVSAGTALANLPSITINKPCDDAERRAMPRNGIYYADAPDTNGNGIADDMVWTVCNPPPPPGPINSGPTPTGPGSSDPPPPPPPPPPPGSGGGGGA